MSAQPLKPEDPDERTIADMFALSLRRTCDQWAERVEDIGPGRLRVHFADGSYADVTLPSAHVGEGPR